MKILRGGAERFLDLVDTADRRSQKADLVAEIMSALAVGSQYVTCIDLERTQRIVDFSWAARQAGRRLGIRVDVESQVLKQDHQLELQVGLASGTEVLTLALQE